MVGVCLFAISLGLGSPAMGDGPEIAPADFKHWFNSAMDGRSHLTPQARGRAARFRYVFVAGYQGESMPGYFTQNTKEMIAEGVPYTSIHLIQPSSAHTVDENRQNVADGLMELSNRGPERLIIIGHSRGACDAMAFALHEPIFVRDRVEAIFLIQGAFGGTGLADFVLDRKQPIDNRMPAGHGLVCKAIANLENKIGHKSREHAMSDMTCDAACEYWQMTLASCADAVPIVTPKLFYIQAIAENSRLRLIQRATHKYLKTYYGPNDGVVTIEDQSLDGVGQIIAVLEAGHADLTRKGLASRAGRRSRQALMQSILMTVSR